MSPQAAPELPRALKKLLTELVDLLDRLRDDQYCALTERGSSIGTHVRHCLQHVDALLLGLKAGYVNYDARERGTRVESDRATAIEHTQRLCAHVGDKTPKLSAPLKVQVMVDDGTSQFTELPSNVAREFHYVISHTIHHFAIMRLLATRLGVELDEELGLAPATRSAQQPAC